MRDVSHKTNTLRTATAQATLKASNDIIERVRAGDLPKGDPLPVAKIAAIQAAKMTPQLIPYCHTVPLDHVTVDFEFRNEQIIILCTAKAIHKTGVEMEALTAASVAALNLYDMLKMLDEPMEIQKIELLSKRGGKSDFRQPPDKPLRAGILVISDSASTGERTDVSGEALRAGLEELDLKVEAFEIVSDDEEAIRSAVLNYTDTLKLDVVMTTGGTGLGPRDRTPETIASLLDRELPGVTETFRAYGQERTPYSMLSRSLAGTRGHSLVICLPGSPSAIRDALSVLVPAVFHAIDIMEGAGHETTGAQQ